ncbi:MAG: hypothetical protein EXR72_06090 [Myxococcales bacterium]|nr:hypothetical protein [Myxococcales bacterium]
MSVLASTARGRPATLLLLVGGCSTSSAPPADADAKDGSAADASTADAGAAMDLASLSDGSSPDAAPPDAALGPSQPNPPQGAKKCGSGSFTDADSRAACKAPSQLLDSWGMQMQPFPRVCDAATISGGTWEVWRTATVAYVFVRYAGLRATGTLSCKAATLLSLSAVYDWGNGGGDTGNNPISGYAGVPGNDFDVQMPIDAYEWVTVKVSAKAATVWVAPFNALIPGCGAMNSGYRSLVAGAQVTWKP